MYARSANKVSIYIENGYGVYASSFYLNNTSNVSLYSGGEGGFIYSYLYAQNSDSVSIKCITDGGSACENSYYYLPADNKASISCHATGCNNMGNFYVKDGIDDISMDIISWCECDDMDDCLGSFSVYCGEGYTSSVTYSSSYDQCTDCGCAEFVDSISFTQNESDEDCAKSSAGSTSTSDITPTVIGVVIPVLICICFIGVAVYYYKRKKKESEATVNLRNDTDSMIQADQLQQTVGAANINQPAVPDGVTSTAPDEDKNTTEHNEGNENVDEIELADTAEI